jgi:hypothetical protein
MNLIKLQWLPEAAVEACCIYGYEIYLFPKIVALGLNYIIIRRAVLDLSFSPLDGHSQ